MVLCYFYLMANPNLQASSVAGAPDKEFENSIRPSAIRDFSGQLWRALAHRDAERADARAAFELELELQMPALNLARREHGGLEREPR